MTRFTFVVLCAATLFGGCSPLQGTGQSTIVADEAECEQDARVGGAGAMGDCMRDKAKQRSSAAAKTNPVR